VRYSGSLAILFVFLAVAFSPTAQEIPVYPVNVWDDDVTNGAPAVAYNPIEDEYLVVWTNYRAGSIDIYAQRVNGDGSLLTWFAVIAVAGEEHMAPSIAFSTAQQRYLVAWERAGDILARSISWNGGQLGSVFPVAQGLGNQRYCDVAYNAVNDEFVVVYQNSWADGLDDVAAQRVRASDDALLSWANVASGPTVNDHRIWPKVVHNTDRNELLFVYEYFNLTQAFVYGKVAPGDLSGVSVASEIQIASAPANLFLGATAGPDEYLVVWEHGNLHAYGRRVGGGGVPQGSADGFVISQNTRNDNDCHQAAGYSPATGYLVAWDREVLDWDLAGRRVATGEDLALASEQVLDDGTGHQSTPDVACAPSGDCLVVYISENNPDDDVRGVLWDAGIFADGFEDGTTAAWSGASP